MSISTRIAAACAAAVLATGLGAVGTATAAPPAPLNGISLPAPVPVASMAFPHVYQNVLIPAYGMHWDYVTMFTTDQTRMIRDSGVVPAFAGTTLQYSNMARWLVEEGSLNKVVAAGGCLWVGINRNDKWSPVEKEMMGWFAWTIYDKADIPVYCR